MSRSAQNPLVPECLDHLRASEVVDRCTKGFYVDHVVWIVSPNECNWLPWLAGRRGAHDSEERIVDYLDRMTSALKVLAEFLQSCITVGAYTVLERNDKSFILQLDEKTDSVSIDS